MAQQTLDPTKSFSFTNNGAETSNGAKCQSNFDELYAAQAALEAVAGEAASRVAVVPVAVKANDLATIALVPGLDGRVNSAVYRALTATASALGTITARLYQLVDDAYISDALTIDGQTSANFVLTGGGYFVGGLGVEIASDNADATAGLLPRVEVAYTLETAP